MAVLTVQNVIEAGLNTTYASAAGGGDRCANPTDRRTFLHVKNGGGGDITVTVTSTQSTLASLKEWGVLTRANIAVVVTAGEERMIGPFGDIFNDSAGRIAITYSGVSSVTIAAIRVP